LVYCTKKNLATLLSMTAMGGQHRFAVEQEQAIAL
jgi:hypothetical protein